MDNVNKVKKLIEIINDEHQEYYASGANKTDEQTTEHKQKLHDSIADYLEKQNMIDIAHYYQVKILDSTTGRNVELYSKNKDKHSIEELMDDVMGVRLILNKTDITQIISLLNTWQEPLGIDRWYFRDTEEYRGLHIYFKGRAEFNFPWELQLWDKNDLDKNTGDTRLYKRGFFKKRNIED